MYRGLWPSGSGCSASHYNSYSYSRTLALLLLRSMSSSRKQQQQQQRLTNYYYYCRHPSYSYSALVASKNNNKHTSSSCSFLLSENITVMHPITRSSSSSFAHPLHSHSHCFLTAAAAAQNRRTFATTASGSSSDTVVEEREQQQQQQQVTKSDNNEATATITLDNNNDMDDDKKKKKTKEGFEAAARRRKRQRALHNRWKKRRLQRLQKQAAHMVRIHQLVKHDKSIFQTLFDQLARQHSLKTIMDVLQQIVPKTKTSKNTNDQTTTKPSSLTILLGMLHVTNPNNVPRLAMLELLLSTSRRPVQHKNRKSSKKNVAPAPATFLPSIKKKLDDDGNDADDIDRATTIMDRHHADSGDDYDDAVETMMQARERALHQQLCWSHADADRQKKRQREQQQQQQQQQQRIDRHDSKSKDELQREARDLVRFLSETLPPKNYQSTLRLFEYYVEGADGDAAAAATAGNQRTTLDVEDDDDGDNDSGDDNETDQVDNARDDPLKQSRRNNDNDKPTAKQEDDDNSPSSQLSKNTAKTSSSSRLPVMRKLSRNLEQRTGVHYCQVAPQVAEFFFDFVVDDEVQNKDVGVIVYDARFHKAQEKWDASKEKFVNTMMDLQEKIFEQVEKEVEADELDVAEAAALSDVDDADRALRESEDRLNLTPSSRVVLSKGNKTKKRDRRFRRPAHVVFEAMVLHEAATTDLNNHVPSSSSCPAQNKVFVDNLPIDITVSEITDLYSRCGDLSSIEIFNQRPDLDPGELSLSKIRERRKKQLRSVSPRFRKWQRPRTPVYALLTFADAEGYRVCTGTELRIFGMIIRKHPVRSIPATDMTSLYVEGIPEGSPCIDFEYQLSQQLNPDLLVCLDSGQNKRVIVGSCEIKFPSFELALESYNKLEGELGNVDGVHWMRTPKDAEQWWTRKRGFD